MKAPSKSSKDEARASSERMKTEIIHEQAQQLRYVRQKLEAAESDVMALSQRVRTLELKQRSLQIINEKLEEDYQQLKLSNS